MRHFFLVLLLSIGYTGTAGTDSLGINNFVVNCQIILTNSKPDKNQINAFCGHFHLYENFRTGSSQFIDSLLKSAAFSQNIYDKYRYEYLQGLTAWEIADEVAQYEGLLANASLRDNWDQFRSVQDKLNLLCAGDTDLAIGAIDIPELQRRFLDNKFYDDINMGSENFVNSTFNYLLFRNPTKAELTEGKKMVEGYYGQLFFKSGNSKKDYLHALFSSDAYTEGQVRYWFSQLLRREPGTSELILYCSKPLDVKMLIKEILKQSYPSHTNDLLKDTYKNAMSDIPISYTDITSKSISLSDLQAIEKSYQALSDRDFVHDKLIKSLLYSKADTMSVANQMPLWTIPKDCPHICAYRPADPFLVALGVLSYKVCHMESNIEASYQKFLGWQMSAAPHSPLGVNDAPDNYSIEQKLNWLCTYTRKWVEKYPGEYAVIISEFGSDFNKWSGGNLKNTYAAFILYHTRILRHHLDEEAEVLLKANENGFKHSIDKASLLPDDMLHTKPKEFIQDIYLSLYLRKPTEEEAAFLEQFISIHKDLTVKQIYYAMMTSDEYKYY